MSAALNICAVRCLLSGAAHHPYVGRDSPGAQGTTGDGPRSGVNDARHHAHQAVAPRGRAAGLAHTAVTGTLFAFALCFQGTGRVPSLPVSVLGFARPRAATVLRGVEPLRPIGAVPVDVPVVVALMFAGPQQESPRAVAGEPASAPSPQFSAGRGRP
ncbi:hypothetical protein SAMN05216268_11477 [Streptomyces yunnanensis]|uniref:Uncharacterized protein n=1 Tax=Streptomyces yunnanensis TaxID=156453 RepID=A0A9X8QX20_9ACTN|nr:hypothetical protein SAMN05216268_11477 [Streptomyces yunnanensis]